MSINEAPKSKLPASRQGSTPTFIHLFGIRRSGSHAVIHWLQEGLRGDGEPSVMHVNNVADKPTRPERQPIYIKGKMALLHPNFVILSYEDRTISERHDLKHRKRFSNDRDIDVVVLRSFPNLMASQVQRRHNIQEEGSKCRPIMRLGLAAVRDVWVENARAVLGAREGALTGILFDRWFTDRTYRDEIAATQIGFTNTDSGLNDVATPGGVSSSFDGTSFQGRAQEMHLLDRWRMFTEGEENRDLYVPLVTPEVVELSQELFGYDPSLES